ncbi:HTH-type transcriptional regulator Hpr, partial [Priestia megaterium]
ILCMAHNSPYISIMEIAELGSMHVTTAFNFSKKLRQKGYLQITKKTFKKRTTCIELTKKGEDLLLKVIQNYDPNKNAVFLGALSIKDLYGKLPDFTELVTLIRNIYDEDLITLIDRCSTMIEENLIEEDGIG